MIDSRFEKLKDMVRDRYDANGDPNHDFAHIMRVIGTCQSLGAALEADMQILSPAALLHDIVNVPKDHPDRINASQMAAQEAAELLKPIGYSDTEIERISVVITEHSYSLGRLPSSIESAILQDADRLDALGAVGVMRMVSGGYRLGSVYYHPDEPVPRERELNDKRYTIDHLYVKLFKLVDLLNTAPAKIEGQRRAEFMRQFIAQLESELGVRYPVPNAEAAR